MINFSLNRTNAARLSILSHSISLLKPISPLGSTDGWRGMNHAMICVYKVLSLFNKAMHIAHECRYTHQCGSLTVHCHRSMAQCTSMYRDLCVLESVRYFVAGGMDLSDTELVHIVHCTSLYIRAADIDTQRDFLLVHLFSCVRQAVSVLLPKNLTPSENSLLNLKFSNQITIDLLMECVSCLRRNPFCRSQ